MFITFEGIEGSGKSTQAKELHKKLHQVGISSILTREPGGTEIGTSIRKILLNSNNTGLSGLSELLLYEADRAQHIEEKIIPALNDGLWVICDRYLDATIAYQGYARNQDMDLLRTLNKYASHGLLPEITFLLDCSVEYGINRARSRETNLTNNEEFGFDRFEKEKLLFHEKVRAGYLAIADKNPDRFFIIPAEGTIEKIKEKIWEFMLPFVTEKFASDNMVLI